ncbi:uncharacterized protein LOC131688007 [Topomyia yanbarensis]|uniref:uncharacterized protein LOC131688007 n=1 Tax=Topomyia yanbarensis TaxID=2498891 RepID=UPI00273CC669|nr:uncharacterized protein LOC131688007 [Topomyia yanbarensis]
MPAASSSSNKKPPSMRALTARLKEIQLSFSDIWRFVQSFKESNTVTDIEVRLGKLEELWESFSDTFVEILSHDDYNVEGSAYEKERMEFSDNYYEVKTFLMDKVKELQEPQVLEQSLRAGDGLPHGTSDHVRLPQIKLQTFNGDVDEWLSFRDLFTSLIHWKVDLPEVEKFHYLKGCLQGEPKSLIDPLQITKANYQVAWEMLLRRYNNSKQLKKRQVQSLFNLPTLSKESVTDLHVLVEGFERIVQTLDQVIQPADYKDLLLVNILTARLDPVTRRGWEEVSASKESDTLVDLSDFLRRRIQVLDCLPSRAVDTRGVQQAAQQLKPKQQPVRTSYSSTQASGGRCVSCSADHLLYQCSAFQKMAVTDRDALLKVHALCRNCFRAGHQARDCQSKFSCRNCKGRHHTLVCFKPERNNDARVTEAAVSPSLSKEPITSASTQVANVAATDVIVSGATHQSSSKVLLATAVVLIEDEEGNRFPARALLDSGSECNFITERLSQRLKVFRDRVDISVLGIGETGTKVKHRLRVVIRSRISSFSRELDLLVLPKAMVNLPTSTINTDRWIIPDGIHLADPTFFESGDVDLVLGIESFFDFFETGRRISIGEGLPTLNESVFGWVICGGVSVSTQALYINCNVSTLDVLDKSMPRVWSCEEEESGKTHSLEEKRCEELFLHTVQRNPDGWYTVALPKNDDVLSWLGESRDIAIRRLQGTERSLAKDSSLRDQYAVFMEGYLAPRHMSRVDDVSAGSVKWCYVPHHTEVKESSTTTKVRVVFAACCKTSLEVSLVGPVIQEDLRSIILRSRAKQIILVSDVKKMFRQINVSPQYRLLQCILWRDTLTDKIDIYEVNTVTYGTKSAPFLDTRTIQQLALDEENHFPLAARALMDDTYMYDVITGADEVDTVLKLQTQLDTMMSRGKFRLRKWASNCSSVLEGMSEDELAIRTSDGIVLDPDPTLKPLGLTWMPITDTWKFQFTIPTVHTTTSPTKRYVLSVITTLFDPLGLLGAAITSAMISMQLLRTLRNETNNRVGWDQTLPPTVGESWKRYHEQFLLFNQLRIDRYLVMPETLKIEIHCCSDASEKTYDGRLYTRSQNPKGEFRVRRLFHIAKVASLKSQINSRMKLCDALPVVQLLGKAAS